jgi:hypothetical protein
MLTAGNNEESLRSVIPEAALPLSGSLSVTAINPEQHTSIEADKPG